MELMADILGRNVSPSDLDRDLIRDLKMTSDDFTYCFAMGIEKAFMVKIPKERWLNSLTGRDAARLLERYALDKYPRK